MDDRKYGVNIGNNSKWLNCPLEKVNFNYDKKK